MREGADT